MLYFLAFVAVSYDLFLFMVLCVVCSMSFVVAVRCLLQFVCRLMFDV